MNRRQRNKHLIDLYNHLFYTNHSAFLAGQSRFAIAHIPEHLSRNPRKTEIGSMDHTSRFSG